MPYTLPWPPLYPHTERLQWMTDVIMAHDGGEQRIQLRDAPRQSWDYRIRGQGRDAQKIASYLYDAQSATWYLPVWSDAVRAGNLTAGAGTIAIDTTAGDFRGSSYAMVWSSTTACEVVAVATVAAGLLTLTGTLASSYTTPLVMPCRLGRILGQINMIPQTRDLLEAEFEALSTESYQLATSAVLDWTYGGVDVLTDGPLTAREITMAEQWPCDVLDAMTSDEVVTAETALAPTCSYVHSWRVTSAAAIWAYREWLHSQVGGGLYFWLPTFRRDLTMQATLGSGSTSLDVYDVDYASHIDEADTADHLAWRLTNGDWAFAAVTASSDIGGGVERLTLDANPFGGAAITPAEVDLLCYMSRAAIDGDTVEILWEAPTVATISATLRHVRA